MYLLLKKFFPYFAIIFLLLIYNVLNLTSPRIFNSPDETMHYVFTEHFAKTTELSITHTENYGEYKDLVFPRSTYALGGKILPVGFWGLNMFYGLLAKMFGTKTIIFFTPLLALIAVLLFYEIIKKLFDPKVALVSGLLLALNPIWWYYSARSMFNNVPFISLLIIGAFFLFNQPFFHSNQRKNKIVIFLQKYADDFLGIIFICSALLIRPSEVFWVAIGFLVVLLINFKSFNWKRTVVWILPSLIFLFILFKINKALYPGFVSYSASESLVVAKWYNYFLPFGLHLLQVLRYLYNYFLKPYWWLVLPTLFGLIAFLKNWISWGEINKTQKIYFYLAISVSIYLVLFYGSFQDKNYALKTIGVAINRYWLPAIILFLPFAAYFLVRLIKVMKTKRLKYGSIVILLFYLLLKNIQLVFLGNDGLLSTHDNIIHGYNIKKYILNNTHNNSLIATNTEDKFFWPERQVMVNVQDKDIMNAIAGLKKNGYSLYYFTPNLSEESFEKLKKQFFDYGLSLMKEKEFSPHVLYKID